MTLFNRHRGRASCVKETTHRQPTHGRVAPHHSRHPLRLLTAHKNPTLLDGGGAPVALRYTSGGAPRVSERLLPQLPLHGDLHGAQLEARRLRRRHVTRCSPRRVACAPGVHPAVTRLQQTARRLHARRVGRVVLRRATASVRSPPFTSVASHRTGAHRQPERSRRAPSARCSFGLQVGRRVHGAGFNTSGRG